MASIIPTWDLVPSSIICAGIDEVGRGAWAGPVVAAAVILPYGLAFDGLGDSKRVPQAARLRLDREIRRHATTIGIGWVGPAEIDAYGLSWAVRQSGLRALAALSGHADAILLDGKHNYLADDPRSSVTIHGDALIVPIAAASIIAKVARDTYMEALGRVMPAFRFGAHKGYGTALHRQALERYGATIYHRMSYKPLRAYPPCR